MNDEPVKPFEFKPSRFTIRVKLLLFITLIIAISLNGTSFLATFLFRRHSETLIQEYNLSLARLVGSRVESNLRNLRYASENLVDLLKGRATAGGEARYTARFFSHNPGFIFLGVAHRQGKTLRFTRTLYNRSLFARNNLTERQLQDLNRKNNAFFSKSFEGRVLVENVSSSLPVASLCVVFPPVTKRKNGQVIVVYLESAGLLESFRLTGQADIFKVMMVNGEGQIIAHSDRKEALAATNRARLPIIEEMLKSSIDNKSRKYIFEGKEYLGSFQRLGFAGLGVVSTVEAERVFAAVTWIQRQNILIMLIVLVLAFLFIFFFSKTLTIPIVKLVAATRQIEQANYQISIRPTTTDEVGILTNSFLSMAHGLEEREKIKSSFGKFVNEEIVKRALKGEIKLGGEYKKCAVLFSDLRNFTAMSENKDPADVLEFLNLYFSNIVECIHQTGGVVDKFIGDAVMAHWGALSSSGNDTENAINTALMMRQAILDYNQIHRRSEWPQFRFGCGISTGQVIAGQMGSETRLEYTVIGDTVNLASRIEYLNKILGTDILISEASYQEVRGIYRLGRTPEVTLKGRQQSETLYVVFGRADDPSTPHSLKELRARIGIEYDQVQAEAQLRESSDKIFGRKKLSKDDDIKE